MENKSLLIEKFKRTTQYQVQLIREKVTNERPNIKEEMELTDSYTMILQLISSFLEG